ncbi:MAG: sulfite exporter TauE/SafE family protein [Hylemonella sp.]|nr:sulfite exporter TauE/SafE family protein [Hylemonella sp.]
MQTTLAVTALIMGVAGGPHCIAMCGAACAGIGQVAGAHRAQAMWTFQLGRVLGYAAAGALAAASLQAVGWLSVQTAVLRPVWSLFHVAAMMLGLLLLWKAQQPIWLESGARRLWSRVRQFAATRGRGGPLVIGMLWTFLPCGLLYSALLVAALSGQALQGAAVMALFAVGSGLSMMAGSWLWLRLSGSGDGQWGVRLAGLALAASSGWALWMGLVHDQAPWCATP